MRLAVTGASGFVGRRVVACAVAAGHDVTAIVRSGVAGAGESREVRIRDLSREELAPALAGVQGVVHCAARVHVMRREGPEGRAAFRSVNTEGTKNVLEAAVSQGVSRFVYLSTAKVHGEGRTKPYLPSDPLVPVGDYSESKADAEAVIAATDPASLGWTILRPPLVYGPGVGGNFRRLLRVASVGRMLPLPLGGLRNLRSLVSVTNLAEAVVRALGSPATRGRSYLISDGADLSTSELIAAIGRALGGTVLLVPVPEAVLRAGLSMLGRGNEAARLLDSFRVDSTELWRDLGAGPAQTLPDALREVAVWWRRRSVIA
jgi:nucleoside-diphosphate-sugar epimerase